MPNGNKAILNVIGMSLIESDSKTEWERDSQKERDREQDGIGKSETECRGI